MDWLAKETDLASVSISDESASLEWFATERRDNRVACRVTTAHRLAPAVLSHDNSFWSRAKKTNPPQSGASIWRKLTRVVKANIYINNRVKCQAISSKVYRKNKVLK